MADYPNIPNLPGVPALLRVPQSAFFAVSQGLGDASDIMRSVTSIARHNPLAALSSVAGDVADATSIMGGVTSTITHYGTSVMGQFLPAVGNINGNLASITTTIASDPAGPVADIADECADTTAQMDATTETFDAATAADPALAGVESVTVTGFKNDAQWGIFKNGKTVIKADSVAEFGIKKEWTISDYPVEEGGFQSYNKVYVPFDARIKFTAGGSVDNRAALLDAIDTIAGNLEVYDVAMPEKTYQGVNIVHYDVRRKSDNGLGLLIVDVYLEEVRTSATADFSTAAADPSTSGGGTATLAGGTAMPAKLWKFPKSPTAALKKNNGTVQPRALTPADQRAIDTALGQALAG